MSNNKYIVLPGGKECRELQDQMFCLEEIKVAIGEPIALTEVMTEGVEVSGSEVWQWRTNVASSQWIGVEPYNKYDYEINGYETRIAIKPLKAIAPVQDNDVDKIMDFFEKFVNTPSPNVVENKETVEDIELQLGLRDIHIQNLEIRLNHLSKA